MIKRLFTALTLLLFCGSALFAQNTLTVPSVTIAKGKSMSLPVRMNNTADIVAVQFTLTLPDGITLDTENCVLAERAADLPVFPEEALSAVMRPICVITDAVDHNGFSLQFLSCSHLIPPSS